LNVWNWLTLFERSLDWRVIEELSMSIIEPAAVNADLSVSNGVDSIEVKATHEWSGLIGGYLENVAGLAKGVIDEVLTKKFNSHLPTPREDYGQLRSKQRLS
jgi:hypothetical protein